MCKSCTIPKRFSGSEIDPSLQKVNKAEFQRPHGSDFKTSFNFQWASEKNEGTTPPSKEGNLPNFKPADEPEDPRLHHFNIQQLVKNHLLYIFLGSSSEALTQKPIHLHADVGATFLCVNVRFHHGERSR